jgi:hypothetical protein
MRATSHVAYAAHFNEGEDVHFHVFLVFLIDPSQFLHGRGNLDKTRSIGSRFQCSTIRIIFHLLVNARHHGLEFTVDFFGLPRQVLCIL